MAKEFIEISEEEYLGGGKDFIEVSEEEFNTPLPKIESATNTMEVTARELETGVARAGLGFAQGIAGGVRGFTDLFGADNAVSKKIAGYEKDMDQLITAEAKKDTEEVTRLFKEVEGKGILPQVVAGFEAFKTMPTETISGAAGYMIPNIALGLVGKAAQLGRAGMIGLQAGAGAAQGAGIMKGQIYSAVKDELRQQGVAEDKVDEIASKAQAYGGKNLDQILLGAGLNALAASTGAEAILTRVLSGTGKASSGVIKGVLKGGLAEAPVEFIQGGQEQVAQNLALQREGVDVPTMQGVIPAATMEATAGLLIGGAAGGIESLSPEQKAEIEITKEANRKARDLEAPDTATQAIAAAITNLERGIDNKRKDLDVLESTSPEAAKLRLDIAADQKILAQSKEQANKLGLSETITEAEKQQIELAKQIAAPEVVAVAETATPVPVEQVVTPPVVEGLQAVSENTATPEQLTQLSESGLVDIVKGEPVINEEGQAVLTEAQAPLPILTPEERRAEIEAAPVAETPAVTETTPTAESLVPPAALENIKKNPDLYEAVRKDALSGSRVVPYISNSVSSRNLPKAFSQSLIAKVKKQVGDNPSISAIEDAIETQVEKTVYSKEKKKADEVKLETALQRTGETYELDTAIQDYRNKQIELERAQKSMLITPALRQAERVGAKNNLEKSKQKLIEIANKPTPAVSETITPAAEPAAKPKLGEKGGVLIPSREDFIQAGQNIYEAGMEFGAWAKQMIQRFGDAVREFLGEVWQAVSGAPAKLNELMGYLPGKGEAGAVNIGKPTEITEPAPAPIEPEAETITEAMGQGLDIGKEDNMPINNKIESHIKNFAFVRGFFESASDRLRRAKFTKLATAIDDYYDQAQRRLGFANKILLPAFDEYAKQSKANKKKIDEEVKMFYAAQENKRDTAEFFDELNPITQKIVIAWQKFGEESGKDNQRIGIKVFDRGLKRFRPIGRVDKFFPRRLLPKYDRALMEPDKYQKEYNEIVAALIEAKRIDKPEDAERYIANYKGTGTKNDYFSGIESARGKALPEELYDYSMQVMTDYVARWAQHASRIEQFGQKLGENSMTLWDRSRSSTRDRRTIDYITAAQERVEGYFPNDPFVKGMAALNIWASGLQLGNPASATMNMVGGATLNAMIGQPGAASSYVESLVELRKLGSNLQDAREKGIISRDLMNIVGDHQEVLDQNGIAKAGQKTADFLLKWSGFTPVEQMVRTQSLIIGKSFLRKTLSSYSQNPDSLFSKQAGTWLSRNNFDIDKLIVEQGSGPETDKLMRYFATASQGGYTISQTPIFIDTPIGKFLFKYQKFSTQVMRQAWKNTFEPAWKAVTFKGETMQLPSETRQLLYRLRLAEAREIGDNRKISLDEIPQKVSKAEAKALTLIPVMMWLASAYVGGEAILRLRDVLFGVMMKGPDYEDILKALEDDEDDDELYLGLQRAWYNLIGIGALGLIGNYGQFFMDWQDRERVKNPLDPPALSLVKETATLIQNVADQGTITKGDINNYLNRMSSMYRVSQKLYQTAASGLGFSGAPTVAEEIYRRDVADINKYARRWAESAGLEYRTKRPMDIAPSKMTPINRKISSYLQRNDPVGAAAYAKEYLKTLPKDARKNAIQSMESGARNRQPLRLGDGPMDEAEKRAFLKWAKTKMSPEKYASIEKLTKQYESNRKKFLMRLPNR